MSPEGEAVNVTCCDDCPFGMATIFACHHPETRLSRNEYILPHIGKGTTPDWCPLRSEPLTIALEGGGQRFTVVQCDACKTAVRVDHNGTVTEARYSPAARDAASLVKP